MPEEKKRKRADKKPDLSQSEPEGNTETSVSDCKYQAYKWDFTLYLQPLEELSQESQVSQLWNTLKENCKWFKFQVEKAPTTGNLHFQGCFSLVSKEYRHLLKNKLGYNTMSLRGAHKWYALLRYTGKEESRVAGPWTESHKPLKPKIIEYRSWQKDIVNMIDGPADDRTIVWMYDPVGKAGKGTLGIHLMRTRDDILYLPTDEAKNLKKFICRKPDLKAVLINCSREDNTVPYGLLESLKEGYVVDGSYAGLAAHFDNMHVIVMANCLPNMKMLSADRWDIRYMQQREG